MTAAQIAAALHQIGLRPVVDRAVDYVLADCPDCHAQVTDALGIWRPLRVIPRGSAITFWCTACELRREVRDV